MLLLLCNFKKVITLPDNYLYFIIIL